MVILKPTELHPEPSSEPALQHSAESLVAFVNHGPAVSWIQDAQLRFTFLSPQFEREFGLSRSVMVGATLFDLFPDAVAADIAERCRDVLDRGETVETVEHIPAHDGSTTTWLVCRFPLQNGSARLLGGIAFNITDRYRAEAALRETEERHRQILDAIADLVFVKGPQSQILWANKAFREMYGMSNEQLRGIVDAPFNEPDYTQKYIRDDAQVFSTGKALEIPEEHVTRHDGKILTVNTVKAPIVDASGNVVMMVGVSRDVTERKRLEAQLQVADRMASIGTLAAGVAHEINNPLSYVIANLDMLCEEMRRGGVGHDYEELARQARDGAERVREIVRGLKAFSRADEERHARTDVHRVLALALNMTSNEIRHRARVMEEYGDTPKVAADETRLAQVFINLLVNAVHAIPEGRADDNEIRLRTSTDEQGRAVIEVCDTGSGIAPAALPRIFDPFFTTKAVGEGTGLGLSICHGIVSSLGGAMTVESQLGKGSVFRVTLPAADVPVAPAPPPRGQSLPSPKSARILIVDDDLLVAASLARALAREHDVSKVHSGRDAIERVRAGERFDVIFCDLMMPVMTGMDFYAELERIAPELCSRVVFITGGAFSSSARQFLDDVEAEWMEKPFDISRVRSMIRSRVG